VNLSDLSGDLRASLRSVRNLVVLSGAGMSTESGVPVFRGPGGLWEGNRPEELATPEAFARDPEKVWRWYRWRLDKIAGAGPHDGHRALVDLEQGNRLDRVTVITQNVDSMHQRAGSKNVLELHGNITRARCTTRCGEVRDAVTVEPGDSACPCGRGRLRPDVVWFGEGLDPEVLARAEGALLEADMAWVVGTSSVVYPAAALPGLAAERGVCVVEVNPEPTPLTSRITHSLQVPASTGLRTLAQVVLSGS
jgi:NAD-dependent deacetylase